MTQLCELCGEREATHKVAIERTMGGSGDPEVDVEVERHYCDECHKRPYVSGPCETCGGSGLDMLRWNPNYQQEAECHACGHPYYRHFDTYDNMRTVGCKYCDCFTFEEGQDATREGR